MMPVRCEAALTDVEFRRRAAAAAPARTMPGSGSLFGESSDPSDCRCSSRCGSGELDGLTTSKVNALPPVGSPNRTIVLSLTVTELSRRPSTNIPLVPLSTIRHCPSSDIACHMCLRHLRVIDAHTGVRIPADGHDTAARRDRVRRVAAMHDQQRWPDRFGAGHPG